MLFTLLLSLIRPYIPMDLQPSLNAALIEQVKTELSSSDNEFSRKIMSLVNKTESGLYKFLLILAFPFIKKQLDSYLLSDSSLNADDDSDDDDDDDKIDIKELKRLLR